MSLEFSLEPLAVALLASFRAGIVLFMLPLLDGGVLPRVVRVLLALSLGFVLAPATLAAVPDHWLGWLLAMGRELAIGFTLAFFVTAFLSIPNLAGDIVAQEMGLRLAQEVDPTTRVPSTAIGRIYQSTLFLMFLAVNGHHDVVRALHQSYESFPVAGSGVPHALEGVVRSVGMVLRHAMTIAAPLFVVMMVASLVMALLAKTVPQLNIMIFGYPLRVLAGLLLAALLFPYLARPGLEVLSLMKRSLLWVTAS